MVYYLYNAAKYRSLTFFSACNPALSFGGMLADNKTEAYDIIPNRYLPQMTTYDPKVNLLNQLNENGLEFPVIVKPNMGYKGFAVRECNSIEDLESYFDQLDPKKEWLIQEYINKKCEYSIMYHCFPQSQDYGVTSISNKKYPRVIGDGVSTMKQLIARYKNAFVDKEYLNHKWRAKLYVVPKVNEEIVLHHIGNYSRGSQFYSQMDDNDLLLSAAMHDVFSDDEEIYFCRLDIKADSMGAVRNGDFKIMEINGAKSEPLHIYDPQYSFWDRIKEVKRHWKLMTNIIDARRAIGDYRFPGNIEGLKSVHAVKRGVR